MPTSGPALAPAVETAPPTAGAPARRPALQGLTLSTGELEPPFDPDVTAYTTTALTSLFPIEITAVAAAGDGTSSIFVNGASAVTGVPASIALQPRQDVVVTVRSSSGEARTYTVRYLPPDFPTYYVAKTSPTLAGTEDVLLSPANTWLLITNRDGDPLYYRRLGAGVGAADFKPCDAGGSVAYSFQTKNDVRLLDGHFRELAKVTLLANQGHGALPTDLHDVVVLGEQHYAVMAYVKKTVDLSSLNPGWADGASVIASVIQEIDHGTVVFEWDSTSVPSLYADSVTSNAFQSTSESDYVHMNSLAIDPADGNFIVSLRHTSSVLELQRSTGAIVWTLGGASDEFGLTAEQRFSHQHHVRKLDDGTLLVFDNGNGAHPTRVRSFVLDEAKKTVSSSHVVYQRSVGQADSMMMGSAFRMSPTRYLIGWGARGPFAPQGPAVTEIVDGVSVWSLTFSASNLPSYRATPAAH